MRFTVVMPSFLGPYRTAAADRDRKIIRAINSVLTQTFTDLEIIVVADGCKQTTEVISVIHDERLRCILIEKSKQWSGTPRNTGIENARGEFIIYLDIDDLWGPNHLMNISTQIDTCDWVWFDDIRYAPTTEEWYQNPCDIIKIGHHGTSNICHKTALPYRWDFNGYAHDHYFIKHLRQNTNFKKIDGGEYYVMHLPNSTIGKGYDL